MGTARTGTLEDGRERRGPWKQTERRDGRKPKGSSCYPPARKMSCHDALTLPPSRNAKDQKGGGATADHHRPTARLLSYEAKDDARLRNPRPSWWCCNGRQRHNQVALDVLCLSAAQPEDPLPSLLPILLPLHQPLELSRWIDSHAAEATNPGRWRGPPPPTPSPLGDGEVWPQEARQGPGMAAEPSHHQPPPPSVAMHARDDSLGGSCVQPACVQRAAVGVLPLPVHARVSPHIATLCPQSGHELLLLLLWRLLLLLGATHCTSFLTPQTIGTVVSSLAGVLIETPSHGGKVARNPYEDITC
jgi:hypothetical protein